ncbi:IS200/IS605 family element transposase accessory protein TnpB [Candidatus Poribacteria bacterium]|nr:IS200/IS605 family element transposase accessory protein TnpB [Candidatus Poribacteria bacterium]
MTYRTHKITLDPTSKQSRWFSQQCGYRRFAYNQALADFKSGLAGDNFQSWQTLNKNFNQTKKRYEWTRSQDQRAALYAIKDLGQAIASWVSKRAKFPKFKGRGHKQSWTTDEQAVRVEGKRIKLPKIGWVKMRQALRFAGRFIKVTISRTAHRWFASITVATEDTEVVDNSTHPVIGIDVGIRTLATLSDGTKYDNPRPLRRYERKLKREARKLSRQVLRSNNWSKQKRKIARLHYRITCIRNDAHHKATTAIVNRASAIGIETLKVTHLLKNKKLAKALSDSALGGFLSKLKTKAEARGIPITEADQFFASSKTCSRCGHKKDDLTLKERTYHCGQCDVSIDRDVNAAINLRPTTVG